VTLFGPGVSASCFICLLCPNYMLKTLALWTKGLERHFYWMKINEDYEEAHDSTFR